jgi:erythromycin esterase-like protein
MEDHLAERADELLRRATALRLRCQRMNERLEALARELPGPASPPDPSEGIRVVAANLALSGAGREEVDSRLRETFGAVDSGPILDEVFAAAAKSSTSAGNGRFTRQD